MFYLQRVPVGVAAGTLGVTSSRVSSGVAVIVGNCQPGLSWSSPPPLSMVLMGYAVEVAGLLQPYAPATDGDDHVGVADQRHHACEAVGTLGRRR